MKPKSDISSLSVGGMECRFVVQGEDERTPEPRRPGTLPGSEAPKTLLALFMIGQLLYSEAFASLAVCTCMPLPTLNTQSIDRVTAIVNQHVREVNEGRHRIEWTARRIELR